MEHPIIINDDGEIENLPRSQAFKRRLAASMAAPIRRSLDYHGIARRALMVDPLPQGALPTYDRDIDVSAVVLEKDDDKTSFTHDSIIINDDGEMGQAKDFAARTFGQRVVVPTFEIFSNPSIKISDVKRRRFNVIDRAVKTARQQIAADIDNDIFKALDDVGSMHTKK
jgi:hypothetical protein